MFKCAHGFVFMINVSCTVFSDSQQLKFCEHHIITDTFFFIFSMNLDLGSPRYDISYFLSDTAIKIYI